MQANLQSAPELSITLQPANYNQPIIITNFIKAMKSRQFVGKARTSLNCVLVKPVGRCRSTKGDRRASKRQKLRNRRWLEPIAAIIDRFGGSQRSQLL